MLIELFGRNFGPFRDEFHLSMLATDIDRDNPRGIVEVPIEGEDEPLRLLRCVGVYGPNASGKSRLLLAARALNFLIRYSAEMPSDQPLDPYEPFLLDAEYARKPTMLGMRAVIEHRVYEYSVEFNGERFLLERLVGIDKEGEQMLFERHGQKVAGKWTADKQFALLTQPFRPNALLLSLADRLAPGLARGLAVGFRRLLAHRDVSEEEPERVASVETARRAAHDARFGPWLLKWLRAADLGIVSYQTRPARGAPRTPGGHRSQEFQLRLVHVRAGGEMPMAYYRESLGTRKLIALAPHFHDLTHGSETVAYVIDEIDASVHPILLRALIQRFNCETPPENVKGQLIFATHETQVLDDEARSAPLRRDQVYLTEKDATGASRVYSIAEFKERNNLNLRRRYLQGRYGALPSPARMGE